jgi:hypothetical protein
MNTPRREAKRSDTNPGECSGGLDSDVDGLLDRCLADIPMHTCLIEPMPPNSDLVSGDEGELERFNRLRTLVRAGVYRVNAESLAAAILDSGDLG